MKRSTLLHLRIPFSLYLMPFFCFAASQAEEISLVKLAVSFFAIHLFFYPASNAYNSYFDRDEESIGGLEKPPPVEKELYRVALIFDGIALLLAWLVNLKFAIMLLIIGLASKAYSHPAVRLKKYPVSGLLTVVFFQGAFTYWMSLAALADTPFRAFFTPEVCFPAALCSLLLLGSYPMTQIYQHTEDARRGDVTISRMLGIRGTFLWTMVVFSAGTGLFVLYLYVFKSPLAAAILPLALSPTLVYFFMWFLRTLKNEKAADYRSTMRLNLLSSVCFITFFLILAFLKP